MDIGKKTGGHWYSQHINVKKFIRERDNYTCQLCGKEGWIVDHKIPWLLTHDSTIANLRVLCHSCNLKLRRKRRDARPMLTKWFAELEVELCK